MTQQSEGLWRDFVRFGFRLLYHELAFTYDAVSYVVSLGQWRCWQRASLDYLPAPDDGLILELAHGTGNLQLDLHIAGYDTVAHDLSPQMGRIASAKLERNNISGNFTRGMAQYLPFADSCFAAVVSTFPTNFIIQPETLREIHRVLQDDGCLVAVLNGVLTGEGIAESFLEWLYSITGQRDDETLSPKDFFDGYGFSIETVEVKCAGSKAQIIILRK